MIARADEWLGAVFGYPVYRIVDLAGDWTWDEVARDAFVFARVSTDCVGDAHRLVAKGFRVVDTAMNFCRKPERERAWNQSGIVVDTARTADFDAVVDIAAHAFHYSRFHLDPMIGHDLADRVKAQWMESYRSNARGTACLVARDDDRVVGFLGIIETSGDRPTQVIDLIGVHPAAQGRGVGRALVNRFIAAAADRVQSVEVGTQAANVPSIRLYEGCGFRFSGASYVLHAHRRAGQVITC